MSTENSNSNKLDFLIKITKKGPNTFYTEVFFEDEKAEGIFSLPIERIALQATLNAFRENMRNTRGISGNKVSEVLSVGQAVAVPQPRELGQRLFDVLFQGDVLALYDRSARRARRERRPLLLKLQIDPTDDLLVNLPWEYLYRPSQPGTGHGEFLTLYQDTPIIRYWPGAEPRSLSYDPPLRVLLVSATPRGKEEGLYNLSREAKAIRAALQVFNQPNQPGVEITHLEAANMNEFSTQIRDEKETPHIIHFIGHGETGGLLFEQGNSGEEHKVSEETLMITLRNASSLRLVVLNACRSAKADRLKEQVGVAQSLVGAGIPAVVAMQFAISDDAAHIFAAEFYKVLAEGRSVDQAMTWGRIAIWREFEGKSDIQEWGTPVLYLPTSDAYLFNDFVPRPEVTSATAVSKQSGIQTIVSEATSDTTSDTTQERLDADEQAKEIESLQKRRKTHQQNLLALQEQQGTKEIDVPVGLLNSIRHEEDQIKTIETRLTQLMSSQERDNQEGDASSADLVSMFETKSSKPVRPSFQNQLTQLYEKGNSAYTEGDWGTAVKLLSRVQKLDADIPDIDDKVEQARQKWGQTSEGRRRYLTLESQYERAVTYYDQNNWENALILFDDILEIDAGYKDVYQKAEIARQRFATEKAEAERLQKLAGLWQQAQHALREATWTEAVIALTQLLELDADYRGQEPQEQLKEATRQRDMQQAYDEGQKAYQAKQWPKAVEAFGKVVSLATDQDFPDVPDLLAKSRFQKQLDTWLKEAGDYLETEHWDQVIKIIDTHKVTEHRPQAELMRCYAHARAQMAEGNWARAAENLQKIIRIRPNYRDDVQQLYDQASQQADLVRLYNEAIAAMDAGQWSTARTALTKILNLTPDDPEAQAKLEAVNEELTLNGWYTQATEFMNIRAWPEAFELWQKILNLCPDGYRDAQKRRKDTQTEIELLEYYRNALSAAGQGEWLEAKDKFERVIRLNPNYRDVQQKLAEVEQRIIMTQSYEAGIGSLEQGKNQKTQAGLKKLGEAVQHLQKVRDIDARYRGATMHLANAEREYKLLKLYLVGQTAFDGARWDEAIQHWANLVEGEGETDYNGDAASKLAEAHRQAELQTWYSQGLEAIQNQNWEQAIAQFNKVIAEEPGYMDSSTQLQKAERELELSQIFKRAEEAMQSEKWREAIEKWELIQAKDPDYRIQDVEAQLAAARHAHKLETLYQEGLEALEDKRWPEAIASFEQVFDLNATYRDVETRLQIARQQNTLETYYQSSKRAMEKEAWGEAIEALNKIQEFDSKYLDSPELLAEAQKQQKLTEAYAEAMEHFEGEHWEEASVILTDILNQEKPYQDAEEKLAQATTTLNLAQQYEAAQDIIQQAEEEDALWSQGVTVLSEIAQEDPDYRDVAALLEQVKRQEKLYNLYSRATVLNGQGVEAQWPEALKLFEEIIEIDADYKDAVPLKFELQAAMHQNELNEAYLTAKIILESDDESRWDEGIHRLQQLLEKEPGYEKAQRLLYETHKRRTDRLEVLRQQADQAKREKKYPQAISSLERLVQLSPEDEESRAELNKIKQDYAVEKRKRSIWIVAAVLVVLVAIFLIPRIPAPTNVNQPQPAVSSIEEEVTKPAESANEEAQKVTTTNEPKEISSSDPATSGSEPQPEAPGEIELKKNEVVAEEKVDENSIKGTSGVEEQQSEEEQLKEVGSETNQVIGLKETESDSIDKDISETLEDSQPLPPNPVTGLQTDSPTGTSVRLTWTNPGGEFAHLLIQRDEETIATLPSGIQTYIDNQLECETSYKFTIVASSDSGQSPPQDVSVTTAECQELLPSPPPLAPPEGKIAVPVFDSSSDAYNVYIARSDNEWQPELFFENGSQPSFSPDGQQLILRSWRTAEQGFGQRLVLFPTINPNTDNFRLMTHNLEDAHPSLSANGEIVFHSRREGPPVLFTLGTWAGAESSPDSQAKISLGENPDWLGERIIFYAPGPPSGLYIMGMPNPVLTSGGPLVPAGAPDGDHIAVSLKQNNRWHIFTLSANEGQSSLAQLSSEDADDLLPTWSPDGNYIAFVSNRGGSWAVWVMSKNGENPQKLFDLNGSIDGQVSIAINMSFGWGEERISWAP
jgi:tetratricopeptide (TPR) repeat protein